MTRLQVTQVLAVFRLELKKTFFARRGLWIYLLAFAPLLLFFGYTVQTRIEAQQRQQLASRNQKPLTARDFTYIQRGMAEGEVTGRLGAPPQHSVYRLRRRAANDVVEITSNERWRYSDGDSLYTIDIANGKVTRVEKRAAPGFGDLATVFATVFQFFYLRLAVFFGCLGIFMNLFRGELLDKSLHFYFIAPVRREVVMAGKFLAGLVAAIVIFCLSELLQILLLGWQLDAATVNQFMTLNHGLAQIFTYLGVTALACVGYGSLFLAAGLLYRNPILPAAAILVWESINPFLPAALKKISVIYYLKSLCPVSVGVEPGTSNLFSYLVSNPDPISAHAAVLGLLVVAAAVLVLSAYRVRRLEIDYTSE